MCIRKQHENYHQKTKSHHLFLFNTPNTSFLSVFIFRFFCTCICIYIFICILFVTTCVSHSLATWKAPLEGVEPATQHQIHFFSQHSSSCLEFYNFPAFFNFTQFFFSLALVIPLAQLWGTSQCDVCDWTQIIWDGIVCQRLVTFCNSGEKQQERVESQLSECVTM